jgi:hypothetical protein
MELSAYTLTLLFPSRRPIIQANERLMHLLASLSHLAEILHPVARKTNVFRTKSLVGSRYQNLLAEVPFLSVHYCSGAETPPYVSTLVAKAYRTTDS